MLNYTYNAWGVVSRSVNSSLTGDLLTAANGLLVHNPYVYKGYYYDSDTGYYYLKSRYYDPRIHRFLSADKIDYLDPKSLSSLNLYVYCGDNPVMYCDPNGTVVLTTFLIGMVIAALIGATVGATSYTIGVVSTYATKGYWSWSWAQFSGATIGGAIGGATTMIPGIGLMLAAGITGFASSVIGMSLQNAWEDTDYSTLQIIMTSAIIGGVSALMAGVMDKIKIPGLNAGRGSYQAISKQLNTKFFNGTISRISITTFTKMLTLQLYGNVLGSIVDSMFNQYETNEDIVDYFECLSN